MSVKKMFAAALAIAAISVLPRTPVLAQTTDANPNAGTTAGLAEVEKRWTIAELTGNLDYLRTLLDVRYRSVSAKGLVTDKPGILAHAVTYSKQPSRLSIYRKNAPLHASTYQINGTTGIVIHYIVAKGLAAGITGVDVFSYDARAGWHAVYSQHTAVH